MDHILPVLSLAFPDITVFIHLPAGGIHYAVSDTGIDTGIEIDGQSLTVHGELCAPLYPAIIKGRCIICLHGARIVRIIHINGPDLLYRISDLIELIEDLRRLQGNLFVYNQGTSPDLSFKIIIFHTNLPKIRK